MTDNSPAVMESASWPSTIDEWISVYEAEVVKAATDDQAWCNLVDQVKAHIINVVDGNGNDDLASLMTYQTVANSLLQLASAFRIQNDERHVWCSDTAQLFVKYAIYATESLASDFADMNMRAAQGDALAVKLAKSIH